MRLRFVDQIKGPWGYYRAMYYPKTKTIEINRHLSWTKKLFSFSHEIPHAVNDLFLGNSWISAYLDFMWDVLLCLIYLRFDIIAKTRKSHFDQR